MTRILLALFVLAVCAQASSPVIQTTSGPISGLSFPSYLSFLGIPFAAPPLGALRWAAPQPPTPWTNIRPATQYSAGCIQKCDIPIGCPTVQNEDCLYLNVFIPSSATPASALPVMVFLPGGRFEQSTAGTPLYDGGKFVNITNVVLVTTNYRLGVFGFMATKTGLSGNHGFFDQQLALEWVRSNIANFGGDAARITLFGQSAGGTSTAVHLTSPTSNPLFAQAIVQSNPWALHIKTKDEADQIGKEVSDNVGCGKGADIDCLRGKSAQDVLAAAVKAEGRLNLINPLFTFYPWTPVIDGENVIGQPLDMFASGKFQQINKPIMFGTVEDEGIMFIFQSIAKNLTNVDYKLLLDGIFHIHGPKVYSFYPRDPSGDDRLSLSKIATDYIMYCPLRHAINGLLAQNSAAAAAATTDSNTDRHTVDVTSRRRNNNNGNSNKNAAASNTNYWQYKFEYVPSVNSILWGPDWSYCWNYTCHAEELPFVFDSLTDLLPNNQGLITPAEKALARTMASFWGNFAHTGNPNTGSNSVPMQWPVFDNKDTKIVFGIPSSIEGDARADKCNFFDEIGYEY